MHVFKYPVMSGGKTSHVTNVEDHFAEMIEKLSRCRHSTSWGEGLQSVNALIQGTDLEQKVKHWKLQISCVKKILDCDSKVGTGCSRGLKNAKFIVMRPSMAKSMNLIVKTGRLMLISN